MRKEDLKQAANRIFILMIQFLILLVSCVYIDYLYLTNIRPDQLAKANFVKTECLVMSKKLSSRGQYLHRYRADFLVNYHANGVQYNRWVSGNGLDFSYSLNSTPEEQLLSDYEDGHHYACWYNPENAEEAYLVPRRHYLSLLPLIVPALAIMTVLILFIRSAFRLFRSKKEDQKKSVKCKNHFEF